MSGNQIETSTTPDLHLLQHPKILSLDNLSRSLSDPVIVLAEIYAQTWSNSSHLPTNPKQAQKKISSWHPQNTLILTENNQGIYGQIHTAQVNLLNFSHLVHLAPNYPAVENLSLTPPDPKTNTCICFSVCCAETSYRVKTDTTPISRVEYLLKNLPLDPVIRRLPYSFASFPNGRPDQLIPYIQQKLKNNQSRELGPTGMHEHFGAIILAVVLNSFPGFQFAAESNVILAYPTNQAEADFFAEHKQKRIEASCFLQPHFPNVWVDPIIMNTVFNQS